MLLSLCVVVIIVAVSLVVTVIINVMCDFVINYCDFYLQSSSRLIRRLYFKFLFAIDTAIIVYVTQNAALASGLKRSRAKFALRCSSCSLITNVCDTVLLRHIRYRLYVGKGNGTKASIALNVLNITCMSAEQWQRRTSH